MADRVYNVLFLCIGNSARSILAAVGGTGIDRERAFVTALRYLRTRISPVAALPLKSLDEMTLCSRLAEIGQAEGASHKRPDVA